MKEIPTTSQPVFTDNAGIPAIPSSFMNGALFSGEGVHYHAKCMAIAAGDFRMALTEEIIHILNDSKRDLRKMINEGTMRLFKSNSLSQQDVNILNNLYDVLFNIEKRKITAREGFQKAKAIYQAMIVAPASGAIALAIGNLACTAINVQPDDTDNDAPLNARLNRNNLVDLGMLTGVLAGAVAGILAGGIAGGVIGAVVGGLVGGAIGLCTS